LAGDLVVPRLTSATDERCSKKMNEKKKMFALNFPIKWKLEEHVQKQNIL